MNEYKQTLLDLQLDQACEQLSKLIKSGKTLPNYDAKWQQFTLQTMKSMKQKIILKNRLTK